MKTKYFNLLLIFGILPFQFDLFFKIPNGKGADAWLSPAMVSVSRIIKFWGTMKVVEFIHRLHNVQWCYARSVGGCVLWV